MNARAPCGSLLAHGALLFLAAVARADDKAAQPTVSTGPSIVNAPSPQVTDTRPRGLQLYARHCLSCHQADGGGVPNMQPAIAGGTWVAGDARALALFVMTGGFDSAGRKESENANVMPPFRQLPDDELAEILTYIRQKFGNGASPVTATEVAAAREGLPAQP